MKLVQYFSRMEDIFVIFNLKKKKIVHLILVGRLTHEVNAYATLFSIEYQG